MDRLIDEIASSRVIAFNPAPTINPHLKLCRGQFAISKISPLPSQRIPNLDRLIKVALPVRIKLYTDETESANSRQSRFSASK